MDNLIPNKMPRTLIFFLFVFSISIIVKSQSFDDTSIYNDFKKHVYILASDSFAGRESGTIGEEKSALYIASEFKKYGVKPFVSDTSYYQNFSFYSRMYFGRKSCLILNENDTVFLGKHYSYTAYSSCNSAKGELVDLGYGIINEMQSPNLKGKIAIIKIEIPSDIKGQFADNGFLLRNRIESIKSLGAEAIIIIASNYKSRDSIYAYSKIDPIGIPVLITTQKSALKIQIEGGKQLSIVSNVDRKKLIAKNVIGTINNNAKKTIVIGAHYDHLGMGKFGSRDKWGKIHYGADDNASGTAMVIELAKYISQNGNKNFNYIFAAFSAEERGLYGSNYFANSSLFDKENIAYMINFDMVGRLGCLDNMVLVIGTGSSKEWNRVLNKTKSPDYVVKKLKMGPEFSDHASFVKKNIPYIYFTTGLHKEYHTPLDTPQSLNYEGMVQIFNHVVRVIDKTSTIDSFEFRKATICQTIKAYLFFAKEMLFPS